MSFMSTPDPLAKPLAEAELRARIPSLFASEPHESRSDRYQYISTWDVLSKLFRDGFVLREVREAATKTSTRFGYTKHLVRMRHQSHGLARGLFPEVCLLNSHDGSSAYVIEAGVFRSACLNGMIIMTGGGFGFKVYHTKGHVSSQVLEGSYEVLETAKKSVQVAEEWSQIMLTKPERDVFAERAHIARFGSTSETPIKSSQLLHARRPEDDGNDLWRTFNRVQENCMRGGLQGTAYARNRRPRQVTSRAIHGIDQDVKLNKQLWALAQGVADVKAEAEAA